MARLDQLSRRFFGVRCSGGDNGKVKAVVLHSTEGSTAAGASAYLHDRRDGSVHIVVDDEEGFLLAKDDTACCGAAGYNSGVIHVEQAGFARWRRTQWLRREMTMRRAAYWTARKLRRHGLKPRRLKSRRELERGGGYTYHVDITRAGFQTTHTDPGAHYPYARMAAWIRFYFHHPAVRRAEA